MIFRFYYENSSMMLEKDVINNVRRIVGTLSTVLFSFDLDRPDFNTPLVVDRTISATVLAPNSVSSTTVQKQTPTAGILIPF